MADIVAPGVPFAPHLGQHPSISICFLVYLLLLHKVRCEGIGSGLRLFAGSPKLENIFEGVRMMHGVLHVAQCCIIVGCISRIHI